MIDHSQIPVTVLHPPCMGNKMNNSEMRIDVIQYLHYITINNIPSISGPSGLMVKEIRVPGEDHITSFGKDIKHHST
jgi:hypothetical protein